MSQLPNSNCYGNAFNYCIYGRDKKKYPTIKDCVDAKGAECKKQGIDIPTPSNDFFDKSDKESIKIKDIKKIIIPLPSTVEAYKERRNKRFLRDAGVIGFGVLVGWGISKVFKIKPLVPMALTPFVIYSGLVLADSMMWHKTVKES